MNRKRTTLLLVLAVAMLLLAGCSEASQPSPTAPPTAAPTLRPTPTPEVVVKDVPSEKVVGTDTPTPPPATLAPALSTAPTVFPTPTPVQVPTSTPLPTPTPTQVPAIVGTVRFLVDVEQVATASQLELSNIGGPSLIRLKDGRYRLYLHSRTHELKLNIISLISADGSQWDVEPGVRIPHGRDSAVDSEVGEPAVYLGLDDKYYMAYTGRFMGINALGAEKKMHRVVFAASDDGLAWSKLNQHYADAQNVNDHVSSADVNIIDGEYVIYHSGGGTVIRATSVDALAWERQNIVFWGHDSTTIKYGDQWYMFARMPKQLIYGKDPKQADERLVMAVSHDGVNWSNNYYQVDVENSNGSEVAVEDSKNPGAVLLPDGSLRVFLQTRDGKRIYSAKPAATLPKLAP